MTSKKRFDMLFTDPGTLRSLKKPGDGLDPEIRNFLLNGMFDLANQGRAYNLKQSGIASRPRTDKDIAGIINTLALQKDGLGDYIKPSELWPAFYSGLEAAGLEPEEIPGKLEYAEIHFLDGKMTYQSFSKRINRIRNKTRT